MKKLVCILMMIIPFTAKTQGIINNGSCIKVLQGTFLRVIGDNGDFVTSKSDTINGNVQNDGKIYIQGKWENNSTAGNVFINRNSIGEVEFNGTTIQTIGGLQMTYFENLTINNASGVTINLDEKIDNTLNLKNGIVLTSTNRVIVADTSSEAIISQSADNFVNGNIRRYVRAGKQYDMAIGTSIHEELVSINISTLGKLTYLDASFINASPGTVPVGLNADGPPISEFLDYGYWSIIPDNDSNTVYDISVTSSGHTNGATAASAHALFYRSNGGAWQNFGVHNINTQSGTGTNPVTAKRTNANSFYEYAIGKSANEVLPIELLNFHALCNNDHTVTVLWSTSSETNNNYFTVYKSVDAKVWVEVGNISGAGNSNQIRNYSIIDNDYSGNIAYYQLKQTDYDGNASLSDISSVNCGIVEALSMSIYPNPFSQYITIAINDVSQVNKAKLRIFDTHGAEVMSTGIAKQSTTLETGSLSSGTYFYKMINNDQIIQSGKLVAR
jgi:hypothetical protein